MSRKIEVRHGWYGCETGCCGTEAVCVEGDREIRRWFEFLHMNKEAAIAFGENARPNLGSAWADAPIEVGDLRCFDEQLEDE